MLFKLMEERKEMLRHADFAYLHIPEVNVLINTVCSASNMYFWNMLL